MTSKEFFLVLKLSIVGVLSFIGCFISVDMVDDNLMKYFIYPAKIFAFLCCIDFIKMVYKEQKSK